MSSGGGSVESMTDCTHEEADTRIMLHVSSAASCGHRSVVIRTNDSDVVVLAVRTFVLLEDSIDELWVAFGTGKNFRCVHICFCVIIYILNLLN